MSMSLYQRCVNKWGELAQVHMAVEEASEFIQACTKAMRRWDRNKEGLAEEIADLRLMLDQMEYIYDLGPAIADWRLKKIDRLEKLLAEEAPKP